MSTLAQDTLPKKTSDDPALLQDDFVATAASTEATGGASIAPVEGQAVGTPAVEEQATEAQAVEAQPVEEKTAEAQAAEAQAVEEKAVEEKAVEQKTAEAQAGEEPPAKPKASICGICEKERGKYRCPRCSLP